MKNSVMMKVRTDFIDADYTESRGFLLPPRLHVMYAVILLYSLKCIPHITLMTIAHEQQAPYFR